MSEEDVEKVSIFLFTAVVIALCKRHGWTEADAWQLVAEAKLESVTLIEAMSKEMA